MIYTIQNDFIKLEVLSLGATINKFIDKKTNTDIVLGFDNDFEYLVNRGPYFGCTVGRNANRIKEGKFEINGQTYQMKINDHANNLHSGDGICFSEFYLVDMKDDEVTLAINMKDGQDGFPGNACLKVTYKLDNNKLVLTYKQLADQDTIFNVTNHSYFNLDGGKANALNHEMKIFTDKVCYNDEDGLAKEENRKVDNTAFDFKEFKKIADNLKIGDDNLSGGGIDHHYLFENFDFKKLVTLRNDNLELTISSDLPGMQIYTANFVGDLMGKYGYDYHNYQGVAIEPQFYPNAINYNSYLKPITKANEEVSHVIEYELTER